MRDIFAMNNGQIIQWRRLAVEAATIVFSILLAFSIDAWWQERSDQIRVDEYLSQVQADMQDNLHRLREAIAIERVQAAAIRQILPALRSPVPISLESAREWTQLEPGFMWYADPRLLDGAITALVATGDINLVRDPQIKTSLIAYLGQLQADMNEFDRGVSQFIVHHDELLRAFEMARDPGIEPGEDELANELLSVQNDKSVAAIFRQLEKNIWARTWYLEQMLAATDELSKQLHDQ